MERQFIKDDDINGMVSLLYLWEIAARQNP